MEEIEKTRRQVKEAKMTSRILAAASAVLLGAAASAGYYITPQFYYAGALAALSAGAALWVYLRLKKLKTLLGLRERWGKAVEKERDFLSIASLHEYLEEEDGAPATVDTQTWRDLNLDDIYALLDRTFSAGGQAVLYRLLRTPCFSPEPLWDRAALIRAFQEDASFREQLQLALLPLGGRGDADEADLLWGRLPPRSPLAPVYSLLALAALISLFSLLFLGAQGLLLILGLFGLNVLIHTWVNRNIAHILPAISNLAALLRSALKISSLNRPEMQKRRAKVDEASGICRSILRKTMLLHPKASFSDADILYEYAKYFFLLEVRAFYAVLKELRRQQGQLKEIYLLVGELDTLQAIASYRESISGYVEPELKDANTPFLDAKEMCHPLLPAEKAVPNSVATTGKGLLVTGSNMSGKSTFLRTMGVNALFAQTIYTCLAASYRASFFRVISSISLEDSLSEGKSFYYQEAERLLKLIRAAEAEGEAPAFCIIDELLSGTNYTERLAASEAILDHLARLNVLVAVATHDLDLAEKLVGLYRCCHFTDHVGRDGLHFDFKLKEGISTTRNAIKLLAYLDYPDAIVSQANSKAGQYGEPGG